MKLKITDIDEVNGDELDEIGRLLNEANSKFITNVKVTAFTVTAEIEAFTLVHIMREGLKNVYR